MKYRGNRAPYLRRSWQRNSPTSFAYPARACSIFDRAVGIPLPHAATIAGKRR